MRLGCLSILFCATLLYGQRSDFREVDFRKADSIARLYEGEKLQNLPVLTHKLTTDLPTPVEKFRAIYSWVGTNIENDYGAYLTTRKKRQKLAKDREAFLEWNSSFTPKVFKRLIADRKTACTGYAYLIREMASLAGIPSEIVNGYGRTPTIRLESNSTANHSWNKVEIDGKWYLCDATWSAGRVILQDTGPEFQNNYFDGYFLADPDLFIKNHYPLEIGSSLLSDPPSYEEFLNGPVVYKEAFKFPVVPLQPMEMDLEITKEDQVSFAFRIPGDFGNQDIRMFLNTGGSDRKAAPVSKRTFSTYTLEYTFEKTGLYDVHFKIDEEPIATYVVRVRRRK